ncbi:hypothetical protein BJY01DRAFT_241749 [Aspergillus pseudoustus]|uniref:DUF7770 domain-containing protein n=1 Tax=Aspergillus pseudoustus TaxID=1810923 RepID=A0ABR4I7Y2_9EURO
MNQTFLFFGWWTKYYIIHFVPKSRQEHLLSGRITHIIAAPHHQDAGTNHWCFYLATSPTTSIQLDCQPSHSVPSTVLPGGSKAFIIISELDYSLAPDVEGKYVLDITPDRGLTVNDLLTLLIGNGRHRYEFDSRGVGCRFWVTEQLELFYASRVLTGRAQIEDVKAAIKKLWPEATPLELDRGAYYE